MSSLEKSESLDKLAPALCKAQALIEDAEKSRVNPAFRQKYSTLGDIWDACREILTRNGLSILQFPKSVPADGNQARVGLVTMLLHESGQFVSCEVETPLAKPDPQGVGSALTYLRRYSLAAVASVCPDDDDGNAASGKKAPEATTQKTEPPKPTASKQEPPKKEEPVEKVQPAFVVNLSDLAKQHGMKAADIASAIYPGVNPKEYTQEQKDHLAVITFDDVTKAQRINMVAAKEAA